MHMTVGDKAEERTFGPISRTDIVRYAGASGDFNPIHHDEAFANVAGFPTVFSIGMLQAGLLATFVTDWIGAKSLRRFRVRFQEKVWPGDELTCSGTVSAITTTLVGTILEVDLACVRQTGTLAVTGSAAFLI